MKTTQCSRARAALGRVLPLVGFGLSFLALPAARASTAEPEKSGATHTLFLGSDISIEWQGKLRPVLGVKGNAFLIEVDHKRIFVPENSADLRLKIEDNLRMTRETVTVTKFKAERAYTPENDPGRKFERAASLSMSAAAETDLAARDLRNAQSTAGFAAAEAAARPTDGDAARFNAASAGRLGGAEASFSRSVDSGMSSINDVGSHSVEMGRELMEERFDALRVNFDVASPKPMAEPYLVVLARFREDPKRPNTARQLVYAQALAPIDAGPRSVQVFRGGLPPGFELEDCQVHLYDRGQEVATTVSRKQVRLGRNEAFQFSLIDYLAQHAADTLSPVPAREFWPQDLTARLRDVKPGPAVHVKIDKAGKPEGVYEDDACTRLTSDTVLAGTIADLRFFPALNKGKATAGVAVVSVGQLTP